MLGTILSIDEDSVFVKINVNLDDFQSIVNCYVLMQDEEKMIVGEIVKLKDGIAEVKLIGEFIDNKFIGGIMRKPSFSASVRLISKEKMPMIFKCS